MSRIRIVFRRIYSNKGLKANLNFFFGLMTIVLVYWVIKLKPLSYLFGDSNTHAPPAVFEQVLIPPRGFCHDLKMLIVVHVRNNDWDARELWRRLYGSLGSTYGYRIMFSLGMSEDEVIQKRIREEAKKYGDIQQADFIDSYKNLTLKHLSWMHYVNEHCDNVTFIMRQDDYVAWNIELLIGYIDLLIDLKLEGISCHWLYNPKVVRKPSKWSVKHEEYSQSKYPDYCCGGTGHIATRRDISRLLAFSYITPMLWVDDAYITGILREKAGVKVLDNDYFIGNIVRKYKELGPQYDGAMVVISGAKTFEGAFYRANYPSNNTGETTTTDSSLTTYQNDYRTRRTKKNGKMLRFEFLKD